MVRTVNASRHYDNSRRRERAEATRLAVLESARELFTAQGYATTTLAQIAERARVNVDTVYTAVGRKPEIMRELVEVSISGQDRPVPAEEREYVLRIHEAATAADKIAVYAASIATIHTRLGPVFLSLRDAAITDATCRSLWTQISERRRANMLRFAADLRATGQLREDLSDDAIADIVWSMNAPEYWELLVHRRGWTSEQFEAWLADAWRRLLLRQP
jgi:AcrR family transcriptional regulator